MKQILTFIILMLLTKLSLGQRPLLNFDPDNNYNYIHDEVLYKKLFERMGYVLYQEFYSPNKKNEKLSFTHFDEDAQRKEYLQSETIYEYDKEGWLLTKTRLSISGSDSTRSFIGYEYDTSRKSITANISEQDRPAEKVYYEYSSGKKPLLRKIVKILPSGTNDTTIFVYHNEDQHIVQVIVNGEKLDVGYQLSKHVYNSDDDMSSTIIYWMPALAKSKRFNKIWTQEGKVIQISLKKKDGDIDGDIQIFLTENAIAYSSLKGGRGRPYYYYRESRFYEFDQSLKVNYVYGWNDFALGLSDEIIRKRNRWVTKKTFGGIFSRGHIIVKNNTMIFKNGSRKLIIQKL